MCPLRLDMRGERFNAETQRTAEKSLSLVVEGFDDVGEALVDHAAFYF